MLQLLQVKHRKKSFYSPDKKVFFSPLLWGAGPSLCLSKSHLPVPLRHDLNPCPFIKTSLSNIIFFLPFFSDCLYILCKLTPVSIERSSQLITILENCQPLVSYEHSANTYEAVRPLIAFSARVRDVLVMVCRKGLYSRYCFLFIHFSAVNQQWPP